MNYVAIKRYKGMSLCGPVNVPAKTSVVLMDDGILYLHDKKLHYASSDRGREFFARDDDGRGLERGRLCSRIQQLCSKHPDPKDPWCAKLTKTPAMQVYRVQKDTPRWLWNQRFFDAPIEELQWIFNFLKEG